MGADTVVVIWAITGLAAVLMGMRYKQPWDTVVAAALLGPIGLLIQYHRGQKSERRAATETQTRAS